MIMVKNLEWFQGVVVNEETMRLSHWFKFPSVLLCFDAATEIISGP